MPRRAKTDHRDGPRCPICRKGVHTDDPFFPFCSERCKLIDLGRWLDGRYRIELPVEATDREVAPDLPNNDQTPGTEGT